jgi:hypothetical protein
MVPRSPQALLLLGHVHKLAGRAGQAGACYAQALREGADPVLVAPLIEALVPAGADAPRADDECPDDAQRATSGGARVPNGASGNHNRSAGGRDAPASRGENRNGG